MGRFNGAARFKGQGVLKTERVQRKENVQSEEVTYHLISLAISLPRIIFQPVVHVCKQTQWFVTGPSTNRAKGLSVSQLTAADVWHAMSVIVTATCKQNVDVQGWSGQYKAECSCHAPGPHSPSPFSLLYSDLMTLALPKRLKRFLTLSWYQPAVPIFTTLQKAATASHSSEECRGQWQLIKAQRSHRSHIRNPQILAQCFVTFVAGLANWAIDIITLWHCTYTETWSLSHLTFKCDPIFSWFWVCITWPLIS